MPFRLYDAAVPVFDATLSDIAALLDKATAQGGDEAKLMTARLAPDMHPLPKQVQIACDIVNRACARLTATDAPSFPDTETSFAELKARIARTQQVIAAIDPAAFDGAEDRQIEMTFPGGAGYRWTGAEFLTKFALPNMFFHATTVYALLRANGVSLGKSDFLQHLGMPHITPAAAA